MKPLIFVLAGLLLALPALAAESGEDANIFAGDLGNMIWTVVIFVLVLVVLGKFAWGPILEGLQTRENFIRDSLAEAKADRDAAEARLKEYEAKLAAARAEATALVEEGRRDADVVRQSIEASAREEAGKIVARARREIDLAKEGAVEEIYGLAGKMAVEMASQVIRKELSLEDHARLIDEAARKIRQARDERQRTN
jgi:F-type H+-transporting ATPase subunit b